MISRKEYKANDSTIAKRKVKELNEDCRFNYDALDFKDEYGNFIGTAVFDSRIGEYSFVALSGETINREMIVNRNIPMNRVVTRSRDNGRKRPKSIYW